MRILIVGDGKVGYHVARQLSKDHDVTVVDNNTDALNRALETLDVLCVKGSASSYATLEEARAAEADVLIAVTSGDELNMICSLFGHQLGAKHIIARIRNPEYLKTSGLLRETLGIDMIINPELYCANEISRLLRYPFALSIESFSRGRIEMVQFHLPEDSPFHGRTIEQIVREIDMAVLFCAVVRHEAVHIPNGAFVLQGGDTFFVASDPPTLTQFSKHMGFSHQKVRDVMIVGGSRIAYYLASSLDRILGRGGSCKLIESDANRCDELSEMLPHTVVIHGDGTDQELLDTENISNMDAFVALMDLDEKNMICSLYASQKGASKIVCKTTRDNYARVFGTLDIGSGVNPKELAAGQIAHYIQGLEGGADSKAEHVYKIADADAMVSEYAVDAGGRFGGMKVRDLRLKPNVLILAILRKNKLIVARGGDTILDGDRVLVFTKDRVYGDLNEMQR